MKKQVGSIKVSLERQTEALAQIKDASRIISKPLLCKVFASMGTEDEGASLHEIAMRANLSPESVLEALQLLMTECAVTSQNMAVISYAPNQIDLMKFSDATSEKKKKKKKKKKLADLTKNVCNQIRSEANELAADPKKFAFLYSFFDASPPAPRIKGEAA